MRNVQQGDTQAAILQQVAAAAPHTLDKRNYQHHQEGPPPKSCSTHHEGHECEEGLAAALQDAGGCQARHILGSINLSPVHEYGVSDMCDSGT